MNKKSTIPGIVIVVCLLLGSYVGSYLVFAEKVIMHIRFGTASGHCHFRICEHQWMEAIFAPLANIESFITGDEIILRS